jgi:[amino group carrier protein]-lysine/ornithine hydrolase
MDEATVLERLLARYSPSGQERGAVAEFRRLARALGYRVRVDGVGNGVAEVGRGRPVVMFLGHIDTVEGSRPVVRRRGRVHGRGAVDAKGPLAAALLAGDGFRGPGTYRVVAAVREETDSAGARHLARGRPPDSVIAGEPSGWDGITIGYKGDLRLEATFARPRTHWSSPFPTATDLAVAWLGGLGALARERSGESPFRSMTAKAVGFSSEPGADPEVARVTVDVRLPPGLSTAEVLRRLPAEPVRPRLRLLVRIEPTEVARTDPVVAALERAIRAEGGRPTLRRRAGTSDLNVVAARWGARGAAYGPGDSRLDHTAREALSLAELHRSVAVLRRAIADLVRPASAPPTPRGSGDGP